MAETFGFDRRRLLFGGAAVAAFAVVRPWRSWIEVVDAPAVERLADLLPADEGTRRVGNAYLASHPDEADVPTLVGALTRSLDLSRSDLAAEVAEVIGSELSSRRIVVLEGWIAAPTEARLAALVTMVR